MGVAVYGVSFDSAEANRAFHTKERLNYPLWSDGDKALALHYGVIRLGAQPFASRITLVLDPTGAVVERFPADGQSLSPNEHADAALTALKRLK
ncbi:MAG: redoxin domain-containing protein [Myxococcales bacterium]|nr:redoxin domain-containing protein [Myxococcales bacterium]